MGVPIRCAMCLVPCYFVIDFGPAIMVQILLKSIIYFFFFYNQVGGRLFLNGINERNIAKGINC